jgi:hypothetical protein
LLLKTDKDGNLEFFNTFGGPFDDISNCVRETSDGGFIFVGDSNYLWLVKTDENGTMLWEKKYETPVPDLTGMRIIVLDDGFLILLDVYYDLTIWLLKTDFNGTELWYKKVGSDRDYPLSIIQTKNGDFVILGNEFRWLDSDFVLIKIDKNGNTLWRKKYEGWWFPSDIVEVEDGGYVIASEDGLIKTNSNGEILWSKTFLSSGSSCTSLVKTSDGGFVLVGGIHSTHSGNSGVFIIKTDSDGNKLWMKIYSTDEYIYKAFCVIESDDGNYVFVGTIAEYDPYTEKLEDIWLVKLSPFENLRANKPSKPYRQNMGKPLISYIFSTSSIDPDGELLYYIWSWGNGKFSNWIGPYENNETCEIKYTSWLFPGNYKIKAKAMDVYGGESDWSDPLTITVNRYKTTKNIMLLRLIERYTLLHKILYSF